MPHSAGKEPEEGKLAEIVFDPPKGNALLPEPSFAVAKVKDRSDISTQALESKTSLSLSQRTLNRLYSIGDYVAEQEGILEASER